MLQWVLERRKALAMAGAAAAIPVHSLERLTHSRFRFCFLQHCS